MCNVLISIQLKFELHCFFVNANLLSRPIPDLLRYYVKAIKYIWACTYVCDDVRASKQKKKLKYLYRLNKSPVS